MTEPDTTADAIRALCDNLIVSIQLLEAERDALQQRVERLRRLVFAYGECGTLPLEMNQRRELSAADKACQLHGDLDDETGEG